MMIMLISSEIAAHHRNSYTIWTELRSWVGGVAWMDRRPPISDQSKTPKPQKARKL